MDAVETGKEKVKKICELLRKQTLEPAVEEAKHIIANANKSAEELLREAKKTAEKMISEAEAEIEKKGAIFKASLHQGARQAMEWLREQIQDHLLNHSLVSMIRNSTSSPQVLADMVKALIKAIETEGLETEMSAIVPPAVEPNKVNELIGKEFLDQLKEKSVIVGPKKGGIQMKLHKDNITIDLSDSALLELLTRYIRRDFHQFFFSSPS